MLQCHKCGSPMDPFKGKYICSNDDCDFTMLGKDAVTTTTNTPYENFHLPVELLPYPVAICFEKLAEDIKKERSALEKLFSLRDLIEVTIKFLAVSQLSLALHEKSMNRAEWKDILTKLARPSLGHWLNMLKSTMKMHKELGIAFPVDIYSHLYEQTAGGHKEKPILENLNDFVAFRNTVIGHGARLSQAEYEKHFQFWYNTVIKWKGLFSLLVQLRLIYQSDRVSILLQGQKLPVTEIVDQNGQMFLEVGNRSYYINPFIFIHLCEPCHSLQLFFYDSNKNYGSAKSGPKVNALEYEAGHKHAMHDPVKELENAFGPKLVKESFKSVFLRLAEIEGKIILSPQLINEHADIYGRRFVLNKIEDFMNSRKSGLFLLTADPGVGKTAISSYLVQNGYSNTHFFYRRSSGIQSPNDFTQSVYHSLLIQYGILEENPSNDPNELRKKLENLLVDVSKNYLRTDEKCVIVIDGLDEGSITSDGQDAFDVLPKLLPDNIYIIATSRNTINLNRIRFVESMVHYHLPSDSVENLADLSDYIHHELALEQVDSCQLAKKLEGNFLLAKLIIGAVKAGDFSISDIQSESLKLTTLQYYYDYYWETLIQQADSIKSADAFDLVYQVLGLLAISKAPLNESQINGILNLRLGAFDKVIRLCRQFLHIFKEEGESYFRIFHDTFRDYIYQKIADSTNELHRQITEYYHDLRPRDPFSYGLRYRLYHLAHAGTVDHLLEWIKECLDEEQSGLLLNSFEDLVERPSIKDLFELDIHLETRRRIEQFLAIEGKSTKVNILSFVMFMLQTELGDKGLSLYFRFLLRDLPTPLARLGKLYKGDTLFEKVHRIIDIGQHVLHFYAIFYSASLMEKAPEHPILEEMKPLLRVSTVGGYLQIIRKTVPILYEKNEKEFESHLQTWFHHTGERLLAKNEIRTAEEFVQLRNLYGHGYVPKEEEIEQQIPVVLEKIKLFLYTLTIFSKYQFFEVLQIVNERVQVRYFQGDRQEGFKEEWISLSDYPYVAGKLYMALTDKMVICLSPFVKVVDNGVETEFILWNGLRKFNARYLNYETAKNLSYPLEKNDYNLFIGREKSNPIDDPFTKMVQEQLETFKGRKKELEAIETFIHRYDNGLFMIYGPPGSGKTSLLAKVSEDLKEKFHIIRYFIRGKSISSQPSYFFDYMNKHLMKLCDTSVVLDQTTGKGRETFFRLIEAFVNNIRPKKLIFFIDAIDEYPEEEQLLNDLNEISGRYCVHIVCSSRRTQRTLEFDKLSAMNHSSFELGSISDVEKPCETNIRAMLYDVTSKYTVTNTHVKMVEDITNGNPLMLNLLLSMIEQGGGDVGQINEIQKSTSNFFEDYLIRIGKLENGQSLLEILLIMAALERPISILTLEKFIPFSNAEIRLMVERIRDVIKFVEGEEKKFELFHESFREYLKFRFPDKISTIKTVC